MLRYETFRIQGPESLSESVPLRALTIPVIAILRSRNHRILEEGCNDSSIAFQGNHAVLYTQDCQPEVVEP